MKLLMLLVVAGMSCNCARAVELPSPPPALWDESGFRKGANEFTVDAGIGLGMRVITSPRAHDWAMGMLDFGWIVSSTQAPDKWFRGNWEVLAEVFGGEQYHPSTAYIVGGGPILRYNFTAPRRFVPFIDVGGGVAATDIRNGDLSTTFEFNLQAGAGAHFFLRDDLALTAQYRFVHISNAGIQFPNLGVNTSTILFGVSWFF